MSKPTVEAFKVPHWLVVDFGSTFTKACAVSPEGNLRGQVYTPTTHQDVSVGLDNALEQLGSRVDLSDGYRLLASSSANGGLRIFVVGFVRDLSLRAAQMAAYGAGGKVIGAAAGELSIRELEQCYASAPDLIVLAGGIDGGDSKTIRHNARLIAKNGDRSVPVIVAGNMAAADDCAKSLTDAGVHHHVVTNLLPEVDIVDADETKGAIRLEFLESIIVAKGLNKISRHPSLVSEVIPTPSAILTGGELVWGPKESGASTLIVDVGGATTDIYSFSDGLPTEPGVTMKGLPEPYAKRTVEGDLGVRENAVSVAELVGVSELTRIASILQDEITEADVESHLSELDSSNSSYVPQTPTGLAIDASLAHVAVYTAVPRHVGTRIDVSRGHTTAAIQRGKDLTATTTAIGTGGVFAFGPHSQFVMSGVTHVERTHTECALTPTDPDYFVDKSYLMFAVGLLARQDIKAAKRLASDSLMKATSTSEERYERDP